MERPGRTQAQNTVELQRSADAAFHGRTVRDQLTVWLDALNVRNADRLVVQQAVGELVTNAVEHAYGPTAATAASRSM